MHLHPCPGRGCPARFVSRELRESVAAYVLLRSGEHERVNERNPSKESAKAPTYIYSGVILLYHLQKNALLCCSDPTSDGQVSILKCHPWIGMLTHTILEGFITEVNHMYKVT